MKKCQQLTTEEEDALLDQRGLKEVQRRMNILIHSCAANEFRLSCKTVADVLEIINIFSEKTHITWRTFKTDPKNRSSGCKNIFYKEYRCQNSNTRITPGTKNPHRKHTNCGAQMRITVKKIGQRNRSKDKHLPQYPTKILFLNEHNHYSDCVNNIRHSDVSEVIKKKFLTLFEAGHSPFSALDMHKTELQAEYGENYCIAAGDRSIYPDLKWCHRLYQKIKIKEYGEEQKIAEKLENKSCKFSDCMRYKIIDSQLVIAICTPLMKRVHEQWPYSSKLLFIDSTGNSDKDQHRVFSLLTHSFAGALPLGIIITSTEKVDVLEGGLKLILEIVGEDKVFYNSGQPDVIMTENCASERNAFCAVFPTSKLLLCSFHILQAVWQYIWKKDNWNNSIPTVYKPLVYAQFKKMVYAKDEAELLNIFESFKNMEIMNSNPKIMKYATDLFKSRELWASHLKKNILVQGDDINNHSEVTMWILKEKLCDRKRVYNLIQLIDFILTRIDPYYQRKLMDFCSGKDLFMQKIYQSDKTTDSLVSESLDEYGVMFNVINSLKNLEYLVDSKLEICTCFYGQKGVLCEHQLAVLKFKLENNLFNKKKSVSTNLCFENEHQRKQLHSIAFGSNNVPSNWYNSLEIQSNENSVNNVKDDVRENGCIRLISEIPVPESRSDLHTVGISEEKTQNVLQLHQQFNDFFLDEIKTQEGISLFTTFYRQFFSIKSRSEREHVLYNIKRSRRHENIKVQSTSVSQRKNKIDGIRPIPPGQPRKSKYVDHPYSATSYLKKKASHYPNICVNNNNNNNNLVA